MQPPTPNLKQKTNVTAIVAWGFYDWANSAFPTIVMTFVFATYFTTKIAKNPIIGTAQWGHAVALAGLFVALASPIFGAIADHRGRRKPWIFVMTALMVLAAAMLWFAQPQTDDVVWTLFWVAIGIIGLEMGMVFYNAMLADLAPEKYLGRVSGWSWGLGYLGGLLALLLALAVINHDIPGLRIHGDHAQAIRFCGPLAAIWLLLFSWPLFVLTPDSQSTGLSMMQAIRKGLLVLWKTLVSLKQNREIFKFLLARLFYIDGLNTIFAFGGIYAAGTFHLSLTEVIQFGIGMNVAAGLGAAVFAWLDDARGAKITILLSLLIMICAGTGLLFVQTKLHFLILGLVVSLCVGPVQAASRSLMVRLSPKAMMTEMFGLYAFSGKATAFLGPWVFGLVALAFNSQRWGMATVIIFLLLGALLLLSVKEPIRKA